MSDEEMRKDLPDIPRSGRGKKIARGALQALGAVPIAGGLFAAVAGAWSETEQEKVNSVLEHWMRMLREELEEKQRTIVEIMSRLDLHDTKISERIASSEFQSLVKKAFREWSVSESELKREYVRNILANAASTDVTSDDVLKMFIGWLNQYSEMHFLVIAAVYNNDGITRSKIWQRIGRHVVREDSADADLYKLLIRDLSTGGVIRQHREVDYHGNFVPKVAERKQVGGGPKPLVSAFDDREGYELTELGRQFVHYSMTDLPLRISFDGST